MAPTVPAVPYFDYVFLGFIGLLNKATEFILLAVVLLLCKFKSRILRFSVCFLYLLVLVIHSAQFLSVYCNQTQINTVMLASTDQIGLLLNGFTVSVVILPAVVQALLLFFAIKFLRLFNLPVKERLIFSLGMLVLLVAWFIAYNSNLRMLASNLSINMESPTYGLVKVLIKGKVVRKELPVLNDADRKLAAKYNLKIYKKGQMRETVYSRSSALFSKSDTQANPNVIVIFVESLSANLLGIYNSRLIPFTPNIDRMAKHFLVVDDYYNHAIPTVNGLRGQLCSTYSNIGYDALSNSVLKTLKKHAFRECLPYILGRHGYNTIYLTHSSRSKYEIQALADFLHFSKVYYNVEAYKQLLHRRKIVSVNELTDHQVMAALWSLMNKEAKKKNPFFIAVSTIQTHRILRLKPNEGNVLPKQNVPDAIKKIYNFDDAFGKFWNSFMNSPLKNSTIVILTGDHVSPPATDYLNAIGEKIVPGLNFDKFALLVYDPYHHVHGRFSANSTSLDLAPSILQLLRIKRTPNRFEGLSLFGDRKRQPNTAALIGNDVLMIDKDGVRRKPDACHNAHSVACSLQRVMQYIEIEDERQ